MKTAYVLSALMTADIASTIIGLDRGCVEANPLADILGMPTLYAMKGIMIISFLLATWAFKSAPKWMGRIWTSILGFWCVIHFLVVTSNLRFAYGG